MIMSIILTVSNFVFPLITYSYVARVLTPIGTGKVAFVNSILTYFSYISILGIPTYGLRECAKVKDDKGKLSLLIQELLVINIVATTIAYIALYVVVLAVPKFREYSALFGVMSIYIMLNTIGVEWVYRALEEYAYITIRSIALKCIAVFLTFLLIKNRDDVLWYGFLTIFTISASNVFNFIRLPKYVSLRKTRKHNYRKHLRPVFMLFLASVITTIYANFDISMIGFIGDDTQVGLYNAALKIKNIVLSISTAITSVIVPRIAYSSKEKEWEQVGSLGTTSLQISLILAIPVSVYVFLFANSVLEFVCGWEYLAASNTLRILMVCVIPLILTNLFGQQLLIPLGNEKRYTQSVFIGLWINIGLNLFLIPVCGALGAAVGTLVTECWNFFWMSSGVGGLRKSILKAINVILYIKALVLASILSCLVKNIIKVENIFGYIIILAIVFFGVYYIVLFLCREPIITKNCNKIKKRVLQWKH